MSIYFDAITERRFYPRVSPTRPLYMGFGGSNLAMLLNLSENGLLVSTPAGLDPNSVFRISIQLNGIPQAIEVNVRTIWRDESQERAGIQMLNLSDHDREQIRKWGALEATSGKGEDPTPAGAMYPPAETPESPVPQAQGVEPETLVSPPEPPNWPRNTEIPAYLAPEAEPLGSPSVAESPNFPASRSAVVPRRPRRRSSVAAMVAWGAVVSVVCLGAALFLNPGIAKQLLGHPTADSVPIPLRASATPSDSSPVSKVENTVPANRATPASKPSIHSTNARLEDQADDALESTPPSGPESKRKPADNGDASAAQRTGDTSREAQPTASSPAISAAVPSASPGAIRSSPPDATTKPTAPASDPATPTPSLATTAQPSTNAANTSPSSAANPANTNSLTPGVSGSSAIAGSIGTSSSTAANAVPHPSSFAPVTPNSGPTATSPTASAAAWPTSGPPVAAGKSPNSWFRSRPAEASPVVQMDVNPGPVMAITPPRGIGSSFITIPGERVIDSPAMTVHIRRAVRVPSEHWIWRGRKQVALGELATRIDPQPAHQPASGSVTVQATIDKEGRVTDLKPLNGSFSFLPGVARAIREWRYEPTYLDGKPVETRAEIEIDFHMATAANHP